MLVGLVALTVRPADAEPVRVMTFNIRFNTPKDGDNAWPHRTSSVVKTISEFDPDVLGVQEPQREQLDTIAEAMPNHAKVGVGRNADGSGEYSAIFYRRDRFDLADAGVFWLSDTPNIPGSRTWGNTLPRICTWARLFDRTNDRRFLVLNTHWDHQSQPARLQSGALIAERLQELASSGEPAMVMGDFNCGEKDPAMAALCRQGQLLKDSFRIVSPDETSVATFNGFGRGLFKLKIDAVLVTPEWQVSQAEIVRTLDDGRYPSDHYPVTATVELPTNEAPVSGASAP